MFNIKHMPSGATRSCMQEREKLQELHTFRLQAASWDSAHDGVSIMFSPRVFD